MEQQTQEENTSLRFANIHDSDAVMDSLMEGMDERGYSTVRTIKRSVSLFREFLKDDGGDFENLSKVELNEKLRLFYISVRTQTGGNMKTSTFQSCKYGICRYLKDNCNVDVSRDLEFATSQQMYKAVIRDARKKGFGRTEHRPPISEQDLRKLYSLDSSVFKLHTPNGLQRKVWFDIMFFLCKRGTFFYSRKSLREMTKSSFALDKDSSGTEYVYQTACGQVEHVDCNESDTCADVDSTSKEVNLKMYACPGEIMCPVRSFKTYISLLHPLCDALWQRAVPSLEDLLSPYWYQKTPLGKNTLASMMPCISKYGKLSRTYSNHSVRVTSIVSLDRAGIDIGSIMLACAIGHKTEASVQKYKARLSESRKREMSQRLSYALGAPEQDDFEEIDLDNTAELESPVHSTEMFIPDLLENDEGDCEQENDEVPPKRSRMAYVKRENMRIIAEYDHKRAEEKRLAEEQELAEKRFQVPVQNVYTVVQHGSTSVAGSSNTQPVMYIVPTPCGDMLPHPTQQATHREQNSHLRSNPIKILPKGSVNPDTSIQAVVSDADASSSQNRIQDTAVSESEKVKVKVEPLDIDETGYGVSVENSKYEQAGETVAQNRSPCTLAINMSVAETSSTIGTVDVKYSPLSCQTNVTQSVNSEPIHQVDALVPKKEGETHIAFRQPDLQRKPNEKTDTQVSGKLSDNVISIKPQRVVHLPVFGINPQQVTMQQNKPGTLCRVISTQQSATNLPRSASQCHPGVPTLSFLQGQGQISLLQGQGQITNPVVPRRMIQKAPSKSFPILAVNGPQLSFVREQQGQVVSGLDVNPQQKTLVNTYTTLPSNSTVNVADGNMNTGIGSSKSKESSNHFKLPIDRCSVQMIQGNDKKTKFYTGLPTYNAFSYLFNFLLPHVKEITYCLNDLHTSQVVQKSPLLTIMPLNDQLLSVLMRLKVGLYPEDVADRFGITINAYSILFVSWINVMQKELKNVPTNINLFPKKLPLCMTKFPDLGMILYCKEFEVETTSGIVPAGKDSEEFYVTENLKFVIGFNATGKVRFVSDVWNGKESITELTLRSGILDTLKAGDVVIADENFDISDTLAEKNCKFVSVYSIDNKVLPPTLNDLLKAVATQDICEEIRQLIKRLDLFHIYESGIPNSPSSDSTLIFHVSCWLTNLI